jgi:hypothetical protein
MALEAELDAAVDDDIEFSFSVTNTSTEQLKLTFSSGYRGDVVVERDGETVWRWSDGRMFTQAIQHARLAPGETLTESFVWSSPSPGQYEARATLEADTEASARTTFTVDS